MKRGEMSRDIIQVSVKVAQIRSLIMLNINLHNYRICKVKLSR
jgi:hypothetical protein